MFKVV